MGALTVSPLVETRFGSVLSGSHRHLNLLCGTVILQ
jgi:hypothetical protein